MLTITPIEFAHGSVERIGAKIFASYTIRRFFLTLRHKLVEFGLHFSEFFLQIFVNVFFTVIILADLLRMRSLYYTRVGLPILFADIHIDHVVGRARI